jgi:hypothetical protein
MKGDELLSKFQTLYQERGKTTIPLNTAMSDMIMNEKSGGISKEASVAYLKVLSGHEKVNPGRDSNRVTPEFVSDILLLWQRYRAVFPKLFCSWIPFDFVKYPQSLTSLHT